MVKPGQIWEFDAYDGGMHVSMLVELVREAHAVGRDQGGKGNMCVMDLERLERTGTLLKTVDHFQLGHGGSLNIEVRNGRELWAIGHDLTTEEARDFCRGILG